jgi:hypothetical protein
VIILPWSLSFYSIEQGLCTIVYRKEGLESRL